MFVTFFTTLMLVCRGAFVLVAALQIMALVFTPTSFFAWWRSYTGFGGAFFAVGLLDAGLLAYYTSKHNGHLRKIGAGELQYSFWKDWYQGVPFVISMTLVKVNTILRRKGNEHLNELMTFAFDAGKYAEFTQFLLLGELEAAKALGESLKPEPSGGVEVKEEVAAAPTRVRPPRVRLRFMRKVGLLSAVAASSRLSSSSSDLRQQQEAHRERQRLLRQQESEISRRRTLRDQAGQYGVLGEVESLLTAQTIPEVAIREILDRARLAQERMKAVSLLEERMNAVPTPLRDSEGLGSLLQQVTTAKPGRPHKLALRAFEDALSRAESMVATRRR